MGLPVLIKLVPTILSLMGLAEKLFVEKPESGAEKKDFVIQVVQALVAGAGAVFTGGAANTWAQISGPIGTIIDAAAAMQFPHTPGAAGEGH
jgi:hypothetical protein